MKLSLIAAMTHQGVLGKDNKMPWHLPADFKRLRQITIGKTIVMGRKTYDSIGKALPKRRNVVISRNVDLVLPDAEVYHSLEQALAQLQDEEEVIIFGGATLYRQALPQVKVMYLTFIDAGIEGDAFFPSWQEQDWQLIEKEEHQQDEKNPYNYTFVTLVR